MVAGRSDAVPAASRTAVTPLAPKAGWSGDGAIDSRGGTAVTAEIPAVPVAPAYGVLLPDGSIWYPGSKRKLPAPTFLRVTVWTLAFLVAIAGAGLIVEHYHPSWLDPVRRVVPAAGQLTIPGTSTPSTPPGSKHSASTKMQQTGQSANSVTYSLPRAPYVLSVKARQRCYVVVTSLASGTALFGSTIAAGATQAVSVLSGSATVEVYAAGASLSVSSHGSTVGAVPTLLYAHVYTFNPVNS